jgi:hypothetical protein
MLATPIEVEGNFGESENAQVNENSTVRVASSSNLVVILSGKYQGFLGKTLSVSEGPRISVVLLDDQRLVIDREGKNGEVLHTYLNKTSVVSIDASFNESGDTNELISALSEVRKKYKLPVPNFSSFRKQGTEHRTIGRPASATCSPNSKSKFKAKVGSVTGSETCYEESRLVQDSFAYIVSRSD